MADQQGIAATTLEQLENITLDAVNIEYTGQQILQRSGEERLHRAPMERRQHYVISPDGRMLPWYRTRRQISPSLMGYVDEVEYLNMEGERPLRSVLKILQANCLRPPGRTHLQYNEHDQLCETLEDPWMEMKILKNFGGIHNIVDIERGMKKNESPRHTYLSFPYYNGGELLDYVANTGGPVAENMVRDIFLEILHGVANVNSWVSFSKPDMFLLENVLQESATCTVWGFVMEILLSKTC
eukprot:gb/GECG01001354.1/.p1 GENE.gb/GECG01001354.1/~~gb/GECG01001354.1/.p1  ORF type:complete len:241 (+),score=23.51 gb/GECG01001354.1/:1-723(+)